MRNRKEKMLSFMKKEKSFIYFLINDSDYKGATLTKKQKHCSYSRNNGS